MRIKLGYSYQKWQMGLKSPLLWDTEKVPHLIIAGTTGGGKTVLSQLILNQLLEAKKSVYICDFKAGGDWDGIVSDYAEYTDCNRLLGRFYDSFTDTIGQKAKSEKYLFFDEFSSFALTKDTKEFKELMAIVSHIAFMGRSFGYHLVFISQQFNSKVIDTAVREQFGIKIHIGSVISTESATMLFPNSDIDKSIHLPRFCGYISQPERPLDIIQLPYLTSPEKLKNLLIRKGKLYS